MNDSHDLLEGNDHPVWNGDTPLQFVVALQTMGDLWTEDTLDCLIVGLLFAHSPSLLFLSAPASPFILSSWTVRAYYPRGLRSPGEDSTLIIRLSHLEMLREIVKNASILFKMKNRIMLIREWLRERGLVCNGRSYRRICWTPSFFLWKSLYIRILEYILWSTVNTI